MEKLSVPLNMGLSNFKIHNTDSPINNQSGKGTAIHCPNHFQ
jgi:hypothetical protein